MTKTFVLLSIAFLCALNTVYAQSSSTQMNIPQNTSTKPVEGKSEVNLTSNIKKLVEDQDLISVIINSTSVDSSNFEARYKYFADRGPQKSAVQFIAGIYPETDFNYIAMPVAYYSNSVTMNDKKLEYAFGRKQTVTNFLDRNFNLGLINPYFSEDRINYTQQGLLGVHGVFGDQTLKLGLNYYPIFLPNQGPMIKEKNGKIIGANRWAEKAPETFMYNSKENSITYRINDYNLYELISEPGFSTVVQVGEVDKNSAQFNLNYSYAPMNDIVLSRTVIADLNLNGSVNVYPVVRYSDKISSDFLLKQNNVTFSLSYINENPRNKLEDNDRAVQVLESIYGYGGGVDIDMSSFTNRNLNIGASYGRFFGGQITDTDSDGKTNAFNISNQRLLFKQPYRLDIGIDAIKVLSNFVRTHVSWTYDGIEQGSLLSFKASHRPIPRMNLSLGFDVIGITDDIDAENKKTFLGKHSADDRLTGAFEYVF